MSLAALTWAIGLPHDACSHTAFRVLCKLADVTRSDLGYTAWRSVTGDRGMATELRVHPRTIQRALAELQAQGLIRRGDQRYVEHMRGDRRPTVFDILTPALLLTEQLNDRDAEQESS